MTVVRLMHDTEIGNGMAYRQRSSGRTDQQALYDALEVLVMMFVVLLVVGALGLHVMG